MQNCENLQGGKCLAFRTINKGFDETVIHGPSLATTEEAWGGSEHNPHFIGLWGRCLAASDSEAQQKCDNFTTLRFARISA
ncbi:MAG: hypothetical protein AAB649_02915, partial [Patescibacteria group bacterium]